MAGVVELRGRKPVGGDGEATFLEVPALTLNELTKRAFDIVLATTGLIFFAPIILTISITIKLGSRGPVFAREFLYGYKNRPIRVIKFRLATTSAAGEVRLTWVARVLSRTGIDELPQLFNVLRGEMSIVGRRNVDRWPASSPHKFERHPRHRWPRK